jgi:hypothetical protein
MKMTLKWQVVVTPGLTVAKIRAAPKINFKKLYF